MSDAAAGGGPGPSRPTSRGPREAGIRQLLQEVLRLLWESRNEAQKGMDVIMAAIDDLTNAVNNQNTSVSKLATTVSAATAQLAKETQEIADLTAKLAAGNPAEQALADLAAKVAADTATVDQATSALEVAVPPTPAPAG